MNISIRHNDDHVKINDLGFITHWTSNSLIDESHPIYLVLFEEYSRINPFCQPMDMSEHITVKSWSESRLLYTKKICGFSFEHEIRAVEGGIDWLLSFDDICTNHSIGLAVPYYEDWSDFSQEPIKEDIANYSNLFNRSLYADQHILDIPCIVADTVVFGNMKGNYQFFRYKDGDSHWLRITASTSNPTNNAIEICVRCRSSEIQVLYLTKFPESHEFVHKWKTQFKHLGKRFGLDITCQPSETELTKEGVTYSSKSFSSEKDLEQFYPILKRELEKYPESFFVGLGIKCIHLCSDLWVEVDRSKKKIDGRLWAEGESGIILDVEALISIIHHEIFHGIQRKKKFYDMPGELSQISDFVRITGISEYLAELFAMLMTSPGKAYSPTSGVTIDQIQYLKEGVKEFLSFPDLSSGAEQRKLIAMTANGATEIEFGDICETATRYVFKDKLCQSS